MARNKHVIILGAGASATSGYPIARHLTKLMADRVHFRKYVTELIGRDEHDQVGEQGLLNITLGEFNAFEPVSKLLKLGSFATMDELSNLAFGGERAGDILQLKRWLRYIFGLDNPQIWHWGSSDYPPFINAVFQGNEIPRDDICVLSFNYDPYLEYLFMAALEARHSLRVVDEKKKRYLQQAATSGFFDLNDLGWLLEDGFTHLKLHGTAALPATQSRIDSKVFTSAHLLARRLLERFRHSELSEQHPPVLLPWEIVHPKEARLLTEAEFKDTVGPEWQHISLYPLFKGVWERARDEVRIASKVSFVGISMGKFLEPELRYLFTELSPNRKLEIVVANPGNKHTKRGGMDTPTDRHSPAGKTYHLLREIVRENLMRTNKPVKMEGFDHCITIRWLLGFDEFITLEME